MTMEYPSEPAHHATVNTITSWEGHEITYSVDGEAPFTINAWNAETPNASNHPFWHQPHDLNGDAWADQETAQAFADKWMEDNFINPPAQEIIDTTAETVTPPASN